MKNEEREREERERVTWAVRELGSHVIAGDLEPNLNAAIDIVLDELDWLDEAVTEELGAGSDPVSAVQRGLEALKQWKRGS